MRFRVKYTATAKTELHQAYEWILEQSQSYEIAFKWFNEISQTVSSLDHNPRPCALAPENAYFKKEIRQLLYGKRTGRYRILFTIEEEKTVVILYIRQSARRHLDEEE